MLPGTFDYGFGMALMMKTCGCSSRRPRISAFRSRWRGGRQPWEAAMEEHGDRSDFTELQREKSRSEKAGRRATMRRPGGSSGQQRT